MKTIIEHEKYDTKMESSDWRFSAAIIGLMQYFDYHDIEYDIDDDYILYNSSDITEEKYLEFVEYKYAEELHHKTIEIILSNEEISDEQIKLVNDKLKANNILKKVFSDVKFDNSNKEIILDVISENRYELIKETYRNKNNLYKNYANTNLLFKKPNDYCRLVGYYIDSGKKGKSTGFKFNTNSFVATDVEEFDFIPFSFGTTRESFFINDNYTIKRLKVSNEILSRRIAKDSEENSGKKDSRQALFKSIIETADFINRDVEVIVKDSSKEYFETLYISKKSIDIFKKFKVKKIEYSSFCFSYKITEKYYINIQKEVTDSILNNVLLDKLIELFLKKKDWGSLVSSLIKINTLIRSDETMEDRLKGAYACAKKVAKSLETNKLESYRQKLTSSIIFKDYDRALQILLQLSNYSKIEFGFVYDLYDDFEENKDLIYTFTNALTKNNTENNK